MNQKGFSLLELIIVMAVIAVVMGLGWSGLMSFRATAEMQNAYSELVSVIKTEQNKAKNSVSSGNDGVTPYFYSLFFVDNKYYAFNCGDTRDQLSPTSNSIRCVKNPDVTFRQLPADIKIVPDSKCSGLGFAKLTGKFTSFTLPVTATNLDTVTSFNAMYDQTGMCGIKIKHDLIPTEKIIEVNLDINNLNVK